MTRSLNSVLCASPPSRLGFLKAGCVVPVNLVVESQTGLQETTVKPTMQVQKWNPPSDPSFDMSTDKDGWEISVIIIEPHPATSKLIIFSYYFTDIHINVARKPLRESSAVFLDATIFRLRVFLCPISRLSVCKRISCMQDEAGMNAACHHRYLALR